MAYLKYLTYFKEPQYSRYLQYVILIHPSYLTKDTNDLADTLIACLSSISCSTKLSAPNCLAPLS